MDNNIFNMNDTEGVEKNLVTLIEDEDVNLSGASTPACAVSSITASLAAISALFTVTSACTKSCR